MARSGCTWLVIMTLAITLTGCSSGSGRHNAADHPVATGQASSPSCQPRTCAKVGIHVIGLPKGTKVTMTASPNLGDCGTSFKVTNTICSGAADISGVTVTYPMQVTVKGTTYHADHTGGGTTDGKNGRGGCCEAATGQVTDLSDTAGDTLWSFVNVYYQP